MFNPWHDVDLGEEQPAIVQAIIEIPRGTRGKYELDKKTGMLRLDRILHPETFYPTNYGFIPQTLSEDLDSLDILVLSQLAIHPLCIVRARVIGMIRMIDENENDDKIISVAEDDVSLKHIHELSDLPDNLNAELKHFFEEYKKVEKKTVVVEEFSNKEAAFNLIQQANYQYKEQFPVKVPATKASE